jgi:hypothetical protein
MDLEIARPVGRDASAASAAAVERLNPRFFIPAQHHGVPRRRDVKAHDIARLGHEVRIGRKLECLHSMRPKAEGAPDSPRRGDRQAAGLRHAARTPMRGGRRRTLQRSRSTPQCGHHRSCAAHPTAARPASHPCAARQSAGATCRPSPHPTGDGRRPPCFACPRHGPAQCAPAALAPEPCSAVPQATSTRIAPSRQEPTPLIVPSPSRTPMSRFGHGDANRPYRELQIRDTRGENLTFNPGGDSRTRRRARVLGMRTGISIIVSPGAPIRQPQDQSPNFSMAASTAQPNFAHCHIPKFPRNLGPYDRAFSNNMKPTLARARLSV